ncbi:hypothetical protein [uncultured Thomasclavelia sp.]|uniref:hypothetical protein n=1 Tax=uncultured Thomasclavelia sp. TaxID=3025759 RepID=UPI002592CC51|nr:hypothetical protein [uncultured Thomasclavelia sp.]
MNIEEYILLRKTKEKFNEHDLNNKTKNIQTLIGYIFDYYNIPEEELDHKLSNQILKYQRDISNYSEGIRNWLIDIYIKYKIKIDVELAKILDKEIYFLLSNSDASFQKTSYNIYAKLMKKRKYDFLQEYPLEIIEFIKEYHKQKSHYYRSSITKYKLNLSDKEKEKIKDIDKLFNINLIEWIRNYVDILSKNQSLWSLSHKIYIKQENEVAKCEYNYRNNRNLFELNTVLKKCPKDISIQRKLIEKIMLFFWTKEVVDDKAFYKEYCKRK